MKTLLAVFSAVLFLGNISEAGAVTQEHCEAKLAKKITALENERKLKKAADQKELTALQNIKPPMAMSDAQQEREQKLIIQLQGVCTVDATEEQLLRETDPEYLACSTKVQNLADDAARKTTNAKFQSELNQVSASEECSYGTVNAGSRFSCAGTTKIIDGAAKTSKVLEGAGTITTGIAGAQAMNNASAANTQTGFMKESSKLSKSTGITQVGIGSVNLLAATAQFGRMRKHSWKNNSVQSALKGKNPEQFDADKVPQPTLTGDASDEAKIIAFENERTRRNKNLNPAVAKVQEEQKQEKWAAFSGGLQSLAVGGVQMVNGLGNIKAAKTMNNAADTLGGNTIMPDFGNPGGDVAADAPHPTIVPMNGNDPNQYAAEEKTADSGIPSLGDPFNENGPGGGLAGGGPAPGAFKAGGPDAATPGAGGGGLGGASTSAAGGAGEDPSAKYADGNGKAGGAYDGGAGYSGGRGAGDGKGDAGPDLSGLLAQFLPKEKEEGPGHDSILEYGSRDPAGEGEGSLLDKNANIFERIHETYQEKHTKGFVGI